MIYIPDSDFAIRVWSGGLTRDRQWMFDFFDVKERRPRDLLPGYSLHGAPTAGGPLGDPLVAWYDAWIAAAGIKRTPQKDGHQKWSAREAARLALARPGHPPFYFMLPQRASPSTSGYAKAVAATT